MASPRGRGLRPGGVVRAIGRLIALVCVGFGLGLLFGLVTEEPELLAAHLRGRSESVELQAGVAESDAEAGRGRSKAIGGWDANDEAIASEVDLIADAQATLEMPIAAGSDAPVDRLAPRDPVAGESDSPNYAAAARDLRRFPEEAALAESTRDLPSVASPPFAPPPASTPARAQLHAPVASVSVASPVASAEALLNASRSEPAWSIQVGAFSEEGAAIELAAGLRDRYPVAVLPARGDGGRWRVRVQPIADESTARETAEQLKRDERLPTWVTKVEGRPGS